MDPRTGQRPYAVAQLRKENREGTLLNLVGFQTRLTWPEQRKVFRMIPGLQNAEFVRYGVMHRNTYINGPAHLLPTLQLKRDGRILFAGQITGVEGYMESAATGIVAGINAARLATGRGPVVWPPGCCLGALCQHASSPACRRLSAKGHELRLLPPSGSETKGREAPLPDPAGPGQFQRDAEAPAVGGGRQGSSGPISVRAWLRQRGCRS